MYQKQFAEYFDKHMEEILRDLDEIISIESVGDINAPVKPFGEGSRKALDWGKAYLEKLGMTTKDFDGYAVHGDFYQNGECKLAVLSHLDTVPAGEGWSYPPFKLTKADGKLFGRGTIDDKGPSVAVLWAVKSLTFLSKRTSVLFSAAMKRVAVRTWNIMKANSLSLKWCSPPTALFLCSTAKRAWCILHSLLNFQMIR